MLDFPLSLDKKEKVSRVKKIIGCINENELLTWTKNTMAFISENAIHTVLTIISYRLRSVQHASAHYQSSSLHCLAPYKMIPELTQFQSKSTWPIYNYKNMTNLANTKEINNSRRLDT